MSTHGFSMIHYQTLFSGSNLNVTFPYPDLSIPIINCRIKTLGAVHPEKFDCMHPNEKLFELLKLYLNNWKLLVDVFHSHIIPIFMISDMVR